jgi:hypothetical protein
MTHKLKRQNLMVLSEIQLDSMLKMQSDLNCKVNPDWIAAKNNWYRAILVEAVEAIGHHGWKWWEKQNHDMTRLRMELVDIWHFMLSAIIQSKHGSIPLTKMEMVAEFNLRQKSVQFDNQYYGLAQLNLLDKLDLLVGLAAARRTNLALFESLLLECGMDWAELFRQYVGKNVLNMFRQDHGYKSGKYIKVWDGLEDNEHLIEMMTMADLEAADFRDTLYQTLNDKYTLILKRKR